MAQKQGQFTPASFVFNLYRIFSQILDCTSQAGQKGSGTGEINVVGGIGKGASPILPVFLTSSLQFQGFSPVFCC